MGVHGVSRDAVTATAAAKAAAAAAAGALRLRKRCMLKYAQEAAAMQPPLFDRRRNTSVVSRRDCELVPVEAACVRRCMYAAVGSLSAQRFAGTNISRTTAFHW